MRRCLSRSAGPEREYWTRALKDAEHELEAATRLADVNAAARKLMLAKTEMKRLKMAEPTEAIDGMSATRC